MHPTAYLTVLSSIWLIGAQLLGLICIYYAFFPPNIQNPIAKWGLMSSGLMFQEATGTVILANWWLVIAAWWLGVFDTTLGKLSISLVTTSMLTLSAIFCHGYITSRIAVVKEVQRMEMELQSSASRLGVFDSVPISLPFFLQSVIPYWRPWDVMEHRDITYVTDEELRQFGRSSERQLQLDVLHRTSGPAKRPVLIYIHGGAWQFGDKRLLTMPVCWYMASHNWVVVNINYRLSPNVLYPDHLIDAKRALRWVRENIHKYGGDPDFVAVSGGSAGGHIASMMALTQNNTAFQPGFENTDTSISACVGYYPVVDMTGQSGYAHRNANEWFARAICGLPSFATSESWLRNNACPISAVATAESIPPFLVLQGDNDELVPTGSVRHFVKVLRKKEGALVYYVEFPRAHHAFDAFSSPRANVANWAVAEFLNAVHARWVDGAAKRPAVSN
ncbi:hypothetical protein SpCBS45565_g04303 [Spizellomyces sp. 'palustris']|nr:hypothetical protein SpCBS45565_g04303 [Spizellomyces sp. 'palustris']